MIDYDKLNNALKRVADEVRNRHPAEEHVDRLLLKVGEEPRKALIGLWASRDTGTASENAFEEVALVQGKRLALIGNAGSGKSATIIHTYCSAVNAFLAAPDLPVPLLIDLDRDTQGSTELIECADLLYDAQFSEAIEHHRAGVLLFMDSLDEVLRRRNVPPDYVKRLELFINNKDEQLAGLVLACRRPAWRKEWFATGKAELPVFHLDHLERNGKEYRKLIPDWPTRRAFFDGLDTRGMSDLYVTPFDGFYLAKEFVKTGRLPESRRQYLSDRVDKALEGTEHERSRGVGLATPGLRSLARYLACAASFADSSHWTVQDALDILGTVNRPNSQEPATAEEVAYLLERPLFTRSSDTFSFVHQTYREFLAAEALKGLSTRKQRLLLETELPNRDCIIPDQRGVAMFLAEMNGEFCRHLIAHDPVAAFFGENPQLSDEGRTALLKSVIDWAVREHISYWEPLRPRGEACRTFLPNWRPPDPAGSLKPYLTHENSMAHMWAARCAATWNGIAALNDMLFALAFDSSEHLYTRTDSIDAIVATGDERKIRSLCELIDDDCDSTCAHAFTVWHEHARPHPAEFLIKLRERTSRAKEMSHLEMHGQLFGHRLNEHDLRVALEYMAGEFAQYGHPRHRVVAGLLERARELPLVSVPAPL
ncbi:hypothetical protein HQ576_15465, partial [bacterium]|nr:hypothetical protein [bacterium]